MPGSDSRAVPPDNGPSVEGTGYRSIGGYRLLRPIGEGAMSRVFLGYDPSGLRQIAVKVLAEHLAGNKQFVNRFYREARMSRVLSHPNLIRGLAHGYDEAAGCHYLILEYVDGPNALALLTKLGVLPVEGVVRVGIEIAKALEHLHAQGYVHRDVKPDNILLCLDGSAKLADLGLAKRLSGDVELTTTNQGVGTPHYMPYEQAVNGDLVDGRSDLFALGATLYHLLTGQVPFVGETHEEIVRVKAQGSYQPSRGHRPDVPQELDRILARTLAHDPRARFQNATELINELTATKLAASGPKWMASAESPSGATAGPGPDGVARTRADLSTIGQPDLILPVEPPQITRPNRKSPPNHRHPFLPPGQSSSFRSIGWPLIAVAFLSGLLGLSSRHSVCRRPSELKVVTPHSNDSTAKTRSSQGSHEAQ